jgi:hypothetical protein
MVLSLLFLLIFLIYIEFIIIIGYNIVWDPKALQKKGYIHKHSPLKQFL